MNTKNILRLLFVTLLGVLMLTAPARPTRPAPSRLRLNSAQLASVEASASRE